MSENHVLAQGRFLRLIVRDSWEFAQRIVAPCPVGIVALTQENKVLIIEQFRVPLGRNILEIPAGLVGDLPGHEREDLATAAKRELLEETGYEAQDIDFLMEGPTSAGLCDEVMRLVRARGLRRHPNPPRDPAEQITLHEIPLDQADSWLTDRIAGGALVDPKVFAALYFLRCR